MDHSNDDQGLQPYDDSSQWLDSKQEFPDMFDAFTTPKRRTRKTGKTLRNLTNDYKNDRPLYSTIVKTTCSSIASIYDEHAFPLQTIAY